MVAKYYCDGCGKEMGPNDKERLQHQSTEAKEIIMFLEVKREGESNLLSLPALIAWLEKKPADEAYCYLDLGECLAAQYNASIGREYQPASLPVSFWMDGRPKNASFDQVLEWIAVRGRDNGRTFGRALARARAILAAALDQ